MSKLDEMSKVDISLINNSYYELDSGLSEEQVEQTLLEQAVILINRRCELFDVAMSDKDKQTMAKCLVESAQSIRELQSEIHSRFSLVASKYKVNFEPK